ncbi:hypothetical protein NQ317_014181 [Molorchus minor]|uniref:Uncharacterized protein n=1 Tax=Molorchus minor TaxID=1323400 RepID=A0ABQ9JIT5_9CUCU|nr:hypothetical protein NQ317_014181 [Molorchus minor]
METNSNVAMSCLDEKCNIELKELKLDLSRFRLTGPLSNAILQQCLHIPENDYAEGWMKNSKPLISQNEYWKSLKDVSSPSELPPHMILSLIILDPRLYLPKKRTKALPEICNSFINYDLPENCAKGPIWDSNVRDATKKSKVPNSQLAELHRNLLVPGSNLKEKAVPIPVMLIQRPGKKRQPNVEFLGLIVKIWGFLGLTIHPDPRIDNPKLQVS